METTNKTEIEVPLAENTIVTFPRKEYMFRQVLGRGSFGETVLLYDQEIEETFVCKKYKPEVGIEAELYFEKFVQEIKLLYLINHKNIVRVFSYYLYPTNHVGFILMEYIDGSSIDKFIKLNPSRVDEVFIQTIAGFRYLEEKKILHRDIRYGNILVSNEGVVKIIDFGFGKSAKDFLPQTKSISINWICQTPKEFEVNVYNLETEVYFVGNLFKQICEESELADFSYSALVEKMIKFDPRERISSFSEIETEIKSTNAGSPMLPGLNREVYLAFVEKMGKILHSICETSIYRKKPEEVLGLLTKIMQASQLEIFVNNPQEIVQCFLDGGIKYYNCDLEYSILKDFVTMFKAAPSEGREIILNGIWRRLDAVMRYEDDDLPF